MGDNLSPLPLAGGAGGGAEFVEAYLVDRPTPSPSRKREGDSFNHTATRLAGLTGALLGWRPHEFWSATPAELATILAALAPDTANPADRDLITTLQEQFPDG